MSWVFSTSFSPLEAVAGGSLLGVGVAALYVFTGKILGVSGIVEGALFNGEGFPWQGIFLGGMLGTFAAMDFYMPSALDQGEMLRVTTWGANIAAGLLVGLGTRLGSGCTSGHGICGMARLSPRSFAAVVTFMCTGVVAATTANALGFFTEAKGAWDVPMGDLKIGAASVTLALLLVASQKGKDFRVQLATLLSGAIFALGLGLSGMTRQAKILAFLTVNPAVWDPSLLFVMGSAIPVAMLGLLFYASYNEKALLTSSKEECTLARPSKTLFDWNLFLGAALFGAGWGIGGICPAPAFALATAGYPKVAFGFVPAMFMGMALVKGVVKWQKTNATFKASSS